MAFTPPNIENHKNDPDANNNEQNGKSEFANGVRCGSVEQCVEQQRDSITPEQERSTDGSPRNCFQTLQNVQRKTDDVCTTTSFDNKSTKSQPNSESIQETTETADPVSARELTDQTPKVQTSVTASSTDKDDTGEDDIEKLLRRPMNGFLLFCKKQRVVLRKNFKVQNRRITQMLGKWWSFLTPEEKLPYRNLSKVHKDKVYYYFPDYKWRRKPNVRRKPIARNVTDDTFTDEQAAEVLIQLRASGQASPPITSNRAAESDLGSLNDLCTGTGSQQSGARAGWAVPDQTENARYTNGSLGEPITETPDTGRPSRSCKGKRYEAFMNTMYPNIRSKRANTKKSTKAPVEQQRGTIMQPTSTDRNYAEKRIIAKRLLEEIGAQIRRLPVVRIEHFHFMRNADKKRKKTEDLDTSASDAKRLKTTGNHEDDDQAGVVVDENNAAGSAPNGTMPTVAGND